MTVTTSRLGWLNQVNTIVRIDVTVLRIRGTPGVRHRAEFDVDGQLCTDAHALLDGDRRDLLLDDVFLDAGPLFRRYGDTDTNGLRKRRRRNSERDASGSQNE